MYLMTFLVAGVLYICVHDALGLLGLDRNGFSDPYCVIYCNGKKVRLTALLDNEAFTFCY